MKKVENVTGVVLAGGRSSRYGKNKALVKFEGVPLIERVVHVLNGVFHRVMIITNTPEEYAYLEIPMAADIIKELGPLGGIYTGLRAIADPKGFFVACDMPFLNPGLIRYMVGLQDDYDVVVPKISWKLEALHGLYDRRCCNRIEALIASGIYQVFRFFSEVSVRFVNEVEVRRWDPELTSFLNINTPAELARLGQ